MKSRASIGIGIPIAIVLVVALSIGGTYNSLVALGQTVDSQWAQVQNVYQRRADLVPNLVATVKGAANFEKSTYVAVAEARARVGQVAPQIARHAPTDPQAFARYEQAQNQLGTALSRLTIVAERYPDLKATGNFEALQVQLEGTENRIAVERKRYNEDARAFNTKRDTFPNVLFVSMFGWRFVERNYFSARAGAETPPTVDVNK